MDTPVSRLLQQKGGTTWTVTPDTSVLEALQLMADKDIGALMVMENEQLAGIITERDYARKIILANRTSRDTLVRAIMTEKVIFVRPEQTVKECMALMTARHLRHLPVVDKGQLVGVVSIRDVVAHITSAQEFMIEQLTNYITERA